MAKAIMIQGTMSNAGKSLLAAGLCRIFSQDGYKVAPFKSQNMALNSFVTRDGLEMGRAQVMQAEAAGTEPSVLMNPVLLKPTNDTGSQVIVNGEVRGDMSARDYFRYKKKLVPDILNAYRQLDANYDMIVIEGAGSPAEINLKSDDIVNMGMAKMAHAPVLLVGDIDRGGVFAQLVGTLELLEEDERALVKGLIINKFRGDKTILDPGIAMLERICGKEVIGVTPYMDVDLEDEDSLSERIDVHKERKAIDIAVIRFPRLSNFTDFNVFERFPGVSVRYVRRVDMLGSPDMVILPGTKSTMRDLLWMRQSGMEAAVLKAQADGCVIFGICGGYQMLGETISDPDGTEAGGNLRGMGLLPMDTVFSSEKMRTRVAGRFGEVDGALSALSGVELEGYEIHMGQSACRDDFLDMSVISDKPEGIGGGVRTGQGKEPSVLTRIRDEVSGSTKFDGACRDNVYGTYVHGIFDKEAVARTVVQSLAERKGIALADVEAMDYRAYKEQQYDKLADILREHLDMARIYDILEEGIYGKDKSNMDMPNERAGLIHIYCGDGKGKTTAAVGLAVRFAGNGGRVLFTQFLKDGTSSELEPLRRIPGVEVFSFTEQLGFSFRMSTEEKCAAAEKYTEYFKEIANRVCGGDFGLLVLDEAVAAYNLGFIDREMMLDFLTRRPRGLEVVLTGRDPAPELLKRADYVSEICKKKHPYDNGISARAGIEY